MTRSWWTVCVSRSGAADVIIPIPLPDGEVDGIHYWNEEAEPIIIMARDEPYVVWTVRLMNGEQEERQMTVTTSWGNLLVSLRGSSDIPLPVY